MVQDDGKDMFEVTCVECEHFPPTSSGKGAQFELKYAATHSHKHRELRPREARSQVALSLPSRQTGVGRKVRRRVARGCGPRGGRQPRAGFEAPRIVSSFDYMVVVREPVKRLSCHLCVGVESAHDATHQQAAYAL